MPNDLDQERDTTAERAIETAATRVLAPHLAPEERERFWRRMERRWRRILHGLRPLGGVSQGNRLRVYCDGDELFQAMWAALDHSNRRVVLAVYMIEPDEVGLRTLGSLEAAALRGIDVELRYDSFGSHRLSEDWTDPLREAGVRVMPFNPILSLSRRASPLTRDHRKILVVDDRVGFCGGMNVTEEYAGEEWGSGRFRDTHLRLEGPCVRDLADLLSDAPAARRDEPSGSVAGSGTFVQVLESNRRRRRRAIQKALRVTLSRATERAWITTPYFLPPGRLRRAITKAALRGVDVRILTAGRSDVPLARLASQTIYGIFLRSGVRIFEMTGRVLHAKTVTIDGVYSSVGSFNLDRMSYRHNLEVTVTALDRELAGELDRQFERDLEISREITLERWERRGILQRIAGWVVYRLARFL